LAGVEHEVFISPPQAKPGIEGITNAQNTLIDRCVEGDFSHLWIVQADVEVSAEAFDKLSGIDVDVAQGVVSRHDDHNALICGFLDADKKVWYLPRNAVQNMVLSGWVFAGMSCTLLKRRVLEAGIRFRYERGVGEDILFMFDVQKAGFVAKVDGRVVCGHLPEWPLGSALGVATPNYGVLDVGCGHRSKGDVNVDLYPEPTAHRCADQRVNDDVRLKVAEIPNFVKADACHLPFRDGAFRSSYSWHVIEHLADPEAFLRELLRVSAGEVEVRCPNGDHPSAFGDSKPLHLQRLTAKWFEVRLKAFPGWSWDVRPEFSQGEPWEIVVRGVRNG